MAARATASTSLGPTDLGPRVSPAITTRLVVHKVSQAARISQGLMPSLGPSRKNRSTTSSEMRSHTLSGWPSETLSDVKRKSDRAIFAVLKDLGGPSLQGIAGGSTAYAKFDISCPVVGIHGAANHCYKRPNP